MESKSGRIITFYSYKGGTGRSMALVNVAYLLSRRADLAKGVLVIDWDLEAPGLHWFIRSMRPAPRTPGLEENQRGGVIDLFELLYSEVKRHPQEVLGEDSVQELLGRVPLSRFIASTPAAGLDFMSAGCFDANYGERVSKFDWRGLFDRAPSLIRLLAELLASKYDYVLIDSRTGVNDISGICTALLPDHLVLVFTANHQSLTGGVDAVRKAAQYRMHSEDLRRLTVFPLPSRVDLSEPELLEKWRSGDPTGHEDLQGYQRRLEGLFCDLYGLSSCGLKNYFDEVQIQHIPRYSYGEEIAVMHERGTRLSISRSYATVAAILAAGQAPWTVSASGPVDPRLKSAQFPSRSKIDAIKEHLSESRFRLKLRDVVSDEISIVMSHAERFEANEAPNPTNFANRIHAYEALTNDLVYIQALLGYWGEPEHRGLLKLGPKRLCEQIRAEGGPRIWEYSRWYPALLLLYSGGIAAVAGGRYGNAFELMYTPVNFHFENSGVQILVYAVANAMLELDRAQMFKALPDLGRHPTPRSEHLLKVLGPILEDSLFLGAEYEDAFDRFEALYALEYAHRFDRGSLSEFRYWGPPGRFAWKINRSNSPLDALVKEATDEDQAWGPVKAGFFAGSVERFKEVEAGFRQLISRSSWR